MEPYNEKPAVTELLQEWCRGDKRALDQLLPIIHHDLRDLARRRLRSLPVGSSMQATALVNEVYLRLVEADQVSIRDRAHFFAISATLMRQVLIDAARSRNRDKRGGGWRRIALDDSEIPSSESDNSLLALDEAMERLATTDGRKARVVEMRFFGGMTNGEIAEFVGVSVDTVKRDWTFAKLWLAREIKGNFAL
jgi:RNA polymerase sigma-70 factor (ECF subfamily)